MYFEHYGDQKFAMQRYRLVPAARRAGPCAACDAPCEAHCPYGVRIRANLARAHGQLTWRRT
jgi:predicted aldo/keto reductase-like oxidoreductase